MEIIDILQQTCALEKDVKNRQLYENLKMLLYHINYLEI